MIRRIAIASLCIASLAVSLMAAGPTFRPDVVFKGSALTGWTPLGQGATWRAQNGDIIGTPSQPTGGWLVLGKSYQDVAFYTNLSCSAGCRAGLLLRAEKTSDGGMKGVFVSLTEGDVANYAVTIDAQGRETSRQSLTELAAAARAATAGAAAPGGGPAGRAGGGSGAAAAGGGGGRAGGGGAAGGRGGGAPPLPAGVNLPGLMTRPVGAYLAGQPNVVDITLAGNSLTLRMNGGSLGGGSNPVTDALGNYGPIALWVGGTAPASFKTVAYADLNARPFEDEKLSANFRIRRLSEFYYSYSAAIADFNRDGTNDVAAGPYIYAGPDFSTGRQFYAGISYNPTSEWPVANMVNLAHDFTGDTWPDVLVLGGNAGNGVGTLYVNPKNENRRWDPFVVMQPPDGVVGNEETLLKDIDADGSPEIIHTGQFTLRYSKPDPANPTGPWKVTTISEPGPWGVNISHGLGVGDIDSDGLMDYVSAYGWWKQPAKGSAPGTLWKWHPVAFARWGASQGGAGGAEMGIYDVNGDKLNDVVTALEGHGFGLAWHEQKRSASGEITFVQHTIMDSVLDTNAGGVWFTQPHAVTFADVNQDGVLDMITGKRHHSHFQYADPDNWGMPVVYVYKAVRDPKSPGGARFDPELVHNRSGVGSHIATGDLNKDGTVDFVTSGASGTFVFFNHTKKGAR
jgi:hypothetical protein